MATNPTKWKLNKAETKELEDQAARFYEELIAKGKEKKEAQSERDEFYKAKALEMKAEKAAKSAAKKADKEQQTKANQKSGLSGSSTLQAQVKQPDLTNNAYHSKVVEAKNAILAHPFFKGIEADEPLQIQQKDSGVQAFWVLFFVLFCSVIADSVS